MYKFILPYQGCLLVTGAACLVFFVVSLMASAAAGTAWEGTCSAGFPENELVVTCDGEESATTSKKELAWFRAGQPASFECAVTRGTFSSVKCEYDLTSGDESVQ